MHERLRWGFFATSAAKAGNQPDAEAPSTPAALRRTKSRRQTRGLDIAMLLGSTLRRRSRTGALGLVIQDELARIQQGPEDVGQCLLGVGRGAAALDVAHVLLQLGGSGLTAQGRQEQGLDAVPG